MPSVGEFAGLESRTMTETVRLFPAKQQVGKELFRRTVPSTSKSVYWDVVEGSRKLAKFSSPGAEAHIQPLEPRKRVNTEVLYIREKKTLDEQTKNFIDKVGAFDEPYGQTLLTEELDSLNRTVENTMEWLRWEAIVNGQIDIQQTEPAIKLKVDYSFSSTHKVAKTGTGKWSDTTNSKPLSDLLTWRRLVSRDSWLTANRGFCNSQVMQYMVENSTIQTLIQYTVGDQLARNGYITTLAGVDITVYDVNYKNSAGTVVQYIPDTKFILTTTDEFSKEFQGPIDVPASDDSVRTEMGKVSYSWVTKDPVDTWILVGASTMPAIQIVDAIVAASIA